MTTETYKGRRLRVRKGQDGGLVGSVNGQPMPTRYGVPAAKIIEQLHRDIDLVDQAPVDGGRWNAYWYAPGTYTLCEHDHPVALGKRCRHPYCQQEAPIEPFARPVWVSVSSHRARHSLARIAGETPEYGIWPDDGQPHGEYHCVPGRHVQALERVKGLRVLRGRPAGGRVFRRDSL